MVAALSSRADRDVPAHVAIIMDGNGRWAKARGLPRTAGHTQGMEAVRATVRAAQSLGIRYLTLYGFSSENWGRPIDEVQDLMGLLRVYLAQETDELHASGVRMCFIGNRAKLPGDIVSQIEAAEVTTAKNTGLTLIVALSYGSRDEILGAIRQIAKDVEKNDLQADQITEQHLEQNLYTADIPDPDLIIRTSGEQRLSNFLLWQAAYAELIFLDRLWPDFTGDDLKQALEDFQRRERRYGAVLAG